MMDMATAPPSSRSPDLPLEVTDMIIDHMHDHKPTLRACALVCKAWVPASQYHLLCSIELRCYEAVYALNRAVHRSPAFAASIRELRIYDEKKIKAPEYGPRTYVVVGWASEHLPDLRGSLPNLESLVFCSVDFDRAHAGLLYYLERHFKRVTRLELVKCSFSSCITVLDFLRIFPLLSSLATSDIRCERPDPGFEDFDDDSDDSDDTSRWNGSEDDLTGSHGGFERAAGEWSGSLSPCSVHLQNLTISETSKYNHGTGQLLDYLKESTTAVNDLHSFVAKLPDESSSLGGTVMDVLDLSSGSMRHLDMEPLKWWHLYSKDSFQEAALLENCTRLRSVSLDISPHNIAYEEDQDLFPPRKLLDAILSSIESPAIRRVDLRCILSTLTDLDRCCDWEAVDIALTRDLPQLADVSFTIHCRPDSGFSLAQIEREVESRLPATCAEGILSIQRVYARSEGASWNRTSLR